MDTNFLFRLKPSKASPATQTNAKTGEAGNFRPNPTNLTTSQDSDDVPSSGSVIRHSFDQIYRATPLHPLLASQLRTTSQQVAPPTRILPLRKHATASRLSDPVPAFTPPTQRMISNGLFSTADFVEPNNHMHMQSQPRQNFSPPVQTTWASPPQLFHAPSARAPSRTQEYFSEPNYFAESESNDNYSSYPQHQLHHNPHSFSAPSVSVAAPMSSSFTFQMPSQPFNSNSATIDTLNSGNTFTATHNTVNTSTNTSVNATANNFNSQSMRNQTEPAPTTSSRSRSSRGAQQNSMDSLLALARNNHNHNANAISSNSTANAPQISSSAAKSTASTAPKHTRSDSSPYFNSTEVGEKAAVEDSEAESEETSEATFEEIGYFSAEAEEEVGARHRSRSADGQQVKTTALNDDSHLHTFNQKRKRSQQQTASSFLLQPQVSSGNAAVKSSSQGSDRTHDARAGADASIADPTVDVQPAQKTRSGRVSKSITRLVASNDRDVNAANMTATERTSKNHTNNGNGNGNGNSNNTSTTTTTTNNNISSSSSNNANSKDRHDNHSDRIPAEKTKPVRTASANTDSITNANASSKKHNRKRKGRLAVSSDSDERSVDIHTSSDEDEDEDEDEAEDGSDYEEQRTKNRSRSRAKKRARTETAHEAEDDAEDETVKETETKKETKNAKTKKNNNNKQKTPAAPSSSEAAPLTVAQRLRLLAASMNSADDRDTQLRGVLGRTTVTTAPADPRANLTSNTKHKQQTNSNSNGNSDSHSHNNRMDSGASSDTPAEDASSLRPWTPSEVVALYAVHAKTDITRVDFWETLANTLQRDKGVQRSARDCQTKWFAALHETQRRRERLQQRKQESQVQEALKKMQSMNEATASILTQRMRPVQPSNSNSNNAKGRAAAKVANGNGVETNKRKSKQKQKDEDEDAQDAEEDLEKEKEKEENKEEGDSARPNKKSKQSRLGKNDLKVLAEHAALALRDDDIFESQAFKRHLRTTSSTATDTDPPRNQPPSSATSNANNSASTHDREFSTPQPPALDHSSKSNDNSDSLGKESSSKSKQKRRIVPVLLSQQTALLLDDLSPVHTPRASTAAASATATRLFPNASEDAADDPEHNKRFSRVHVQKIKRIQPHLVASSRSASTAAANKRGRERGGVVAQVQKQISKAISLVRKAHYDEDEDDEEVLLDEDGDELEPVEEY